MYVCTAFASLTLGSEVEDGRDGSAEEAGGGLAARMLDDHRHGEALVQDAQLAVALHANIHTYIHALASELYTTKIRWRGHAQHHLLLVRGIQVDPSVEQRAVHIGHLPYIHTYIQRILSGQRIAHHGSDVAGRVRRVVEFEAVHGSLHGLVPSDVVPFAWQQQQH